MVAPVADVSQPLDVLDHRVEFMSMHDQKPDTVGGFMDGMVHDLDGAVLTKESAHKLVMVAWDVDEPSSFPGLAQEFLKDVVMGLGPVDAAAQLPDVDQVAHDVKGVKFMVAEKCKEGVDLAAPCTQMDVGDPASAIVRIHVFFSTTSGTWKSSRQSRHGDWSSNLPGRHELETGTKRGGGYQ